MASPITFGGLASGIDTESIITKLVQVERQPITNLQQERTDQETRKKLVADLSSRLTDIATSLSPLELQTGLSGRIVSAPTGAPFSATSTGSAPLGSYDIGVVQLAQVQRTYSNAFASSDTAAGLTAGDITIGAGGQTATISVTATDSLNDVAARLNGAGLKLSAAVVYDGNQYRMVINGQGTGDQAAITFSDPSGTTLGLNVAANTVVKAQDAKITIDGLQARSATNTFTGIIPGLTVTASALSTKDANNAVVTTQLGVRDDPSKLTKALTDLVNNFNSAMGAVKKQIPTGDTTKQLGGDTLVGESVVRDVQNTLAAFTITKAGPAGNAYGTLAEIGVTIDRYGTMSLDQTRLQAAVSRDPAAVASLLTGPDGAAKKLGGTLKRFTDFLDGSLSNKGKAIDARMKSIDEEVGRLERSATDYETNLRQQFSVMEQLISGFNSQTSSLTSILNTNVSGNR